MAKKLGGTMFPRVGLEKAEKYARSLVSKTHTGPQDAQIIKAGVFGAGGDAGTIRLSACRQFGFVDGLNKELQASELAKELAFAVDDRRAELLQSAFLKPPVFHKLHTAFQGDLRSLAEIKQQAQRFNVHPELVDTCASLFVSSGIFAGLIVAEGDKYRIHQKGSAAPLGQTNIQDASLKDGDQLDELDQVEDLGAEDEESENQGTDAKARRTKRTNSNVSIDLKIDSSMDADKLAKMLRLLRENGLV